MTEPKHLFIPGPTNIPDRVRRAMNLAMEDIRAPDFPELTKPLFRDLKTLFKSETGEIFLFPSSGTGAWEAALTNTLSPGDRVIVASFGQFSMLWAKMCRDLGFETEEWEIPWGEAFPLERLEERLAQPDAAGIKAVLVCQNETATGVASDVAGVRRILDAADHPALLMVDGISSIACIEFRMDEWGVDLAIAGSQKGLMLPTGLSVVCASRKALAASETAKCRRSYFDFAWHAGANKDGYFPYTPATQLLRGLRVSLDILAEEGIENVWARHNRLAEGVRRAVRAWGLDICAARAGNRIGHGDGGRRSGRDRQRRCRPHRLSQIQHFLRRRPVQGGRPGVPHWASGRAGRGENPVRNRRGRNRHARLRHRSAGRVRRRRGHRLLPRNRARRPGRRRRIGHP